MTDVAFSSKALN